MADHNTLSSNMEDSTIYNGLNASSNFDNNPRQINEHLQEVNIERKRTITYGIDENLRVEDLLSYLNTLKISSKLDCVQKMQVGYQTLFEVTCKTELQKNEVENTMDSAKIHFNGKPLKQYSNRDLKDIQKIPFIKIMIYEAPYELENFAILQKLSSYGKLKDQDIFLHKYKGTEIHNGIRSLNFTQLYKPIPTTIYIKGNRIKIKYAGQDRTPICAICKKKGHYRSECPRLQVDPPSEMDIADEPPSLWRDTPDDEWETPTPNENLKQSEEENQQEPTQPPKNGTCLTQDTQDTQDQEQEPKWETPKKQRKPNNKKREIKIRTENKFSELDSNSEEQKTKKRRHSIGNTQTEADIAYEEEFGHNKMDSTDDATSSGDSIIEDNYFDASEDEEKEEKVNVD